MSNIFEQIIKIPYTTEPYMERYEGELFNRDPSDFHLKEKMKELLWEDTFKTMYPNYGLFFASDTARYHRLIKKTSEIFGLPKTYHMVELGMMIQEDLVILYNGKVEAAFVAFPSGWNPGSSQGKTLEQIHNPVADGDVLRKMSNKLTQLMCGDYCYHRWVWTLTERKHLSHHPIYLQNRTEPNSIENLWFRTEHQITFPIMKGISSGFLIDVNVTPFTFLSDIQQGIIRESINSMSDNVLKYKRLEEIKDIINNAKQ